MSFLSPAWLTTALMGLAALSIPIIIHYLFRSRYRVVNWAAMQFLKKSLEETTRRIRFRELMLLLLRIALLALLALALMRPTSKQRQGDANAPVDAVFIIDTSGSMAITESGITRLEEAKQAALQTLDALPAQSTFHILQTGRHVVDLGPPSPTNRDQARFVIQRILQGHESAHLAPALEYAAELVGRGSLANKEVYLFSDMQRSDWNQESGDIQNACSAIQQSGELIFVQCRHQAQPANAALINLRSQVALPVPGERVPFLIEVRNTGTTTLNGLTVTLRGSDAERDSDTQAVPPLKPGETVPMTLTTRLEKRGKNTISAELQGDELAIDNHLDAIVETRDRLSVLIVDGQLNDADPAKSASFYLAHALRSSRSTLTTDVAPAIDLTIVNSSEAYPALLADVQACFLVGLGTQPGAKVSTEFADRLTSFVQNGGGLVVFAGGTLTDMGLDQSTQNRLSTILPAAWGSPVSAPPTTPLLFDINSIPTSSFLSAFRAPPLDRLGQTEITQARTLAQLQRDALIVMRFTNNDPALVMRTEGNGCVMMCAIASDMQGSDAPLRPAFLPWIQAIVGQLLSQQSGKKNIVAGEVYSWSPPLDGARHRYQLLGPDATTPVALGQPTMSGDQPRLTTHHTHQAGIYRIIPEGNQAEETGQDSGQIDVFAVVPDVRETASLASLTEEELNEKFTQRPLLLDSKSISTGGLDRSRVQHEWTSSLWWVLLLFCVGELIYGWICNREL